MNFKEMSGLLKVGIQKDKQFYVAYERYVHSPGTLKMDYDGETLSVDTSANSTPAFNQEHTKKTSKDKV